MFMSCNFRAQKSPRGVHFEVEELNSLNPVCTVSVFVQEKADIYLYFLVSRFKKGIPVPYESRISNNLDPEHCILLNACF
jgi:hypothetical protein